MAFKREQRGLIDTFLTREKDRKLFENLNKRLTAIELEHIKKKRREDVEFSKNVSAQMTMLNRVNIASMRKKEEQKRVQQARRGLKALNEETNSAKKAMKEERELLRRQGGSATASPRDANLKQLKMVDLNDTFLVMKTPAGGVSGDLIGGSKQNSARLRYKDVRATGAFHSARPSLDEKYASLIRQYEKNHEMADSRGRL